MIKRTFLFLFSLCFANTVRAMVFDNRYLPLIEKPFISIVDRPSHFYFDLFFMTGKKAFGFDETQDELGIPEIWGNFDEGDLGRALLVAGLPNPLPFVWQAATFPYLMTGKIQTEGMSFSGRGVWREWSLGFNWMVMRADSRIFFILQAGQANVTLTETDALMLDDIRRQMLSEMGLSCGFANQIGFGDLDLYVRYAYSCKYQYKFRSIEAGLRLGGLFPTGERHEVSNPASIPFGGNGHYGIYLNGEAEFELREDWKLGFWLRVIQRFKKIECVRFPINNVSYLFSPIVGPAQVKPGVTVAFLPYFYVENIREGLGMGIQYTLIDHRKDRWVDLRPDKTIPVDIPYATNRTGWSSEFISANVFYDFGKVKTYRNLEPIVILSWDIPVNFIIGHGVPAMNKIALGVELSF